MQKLLLLAFGLLSFSFFTNAAGSLQQDSLSLPTNSDSLAKQEVVVDPKDGFKDLFDKTTTSNGINIQKLNPKAISFVTDYMASQGRNLEKMKSWGKPYFDMMNSVLTQHGLPVELKYLSVIESALKPNAVSWVGAAGPWQFMPATGRLMGLRINRYVDERTDFYKSTHAAARYLTQLFNQFGDWLLVIAAYNGGPGNVKSAIRRSGSRNFWDLQYYLPTESRIHVKKFIATHYIMEGEGGVTTQTRKEVQEAFVESVLAPAAETEVISISGKYHGAVIAQHVHMDAVSFNQLNPNLDKTLAATGSYNLRLPADKVLLFQANKPQILEQSIKLMLSAEL